MINKKKQTSPPGSYSDQFTQTSNQPIATQRGDPQDIARNDTQADCPADGLIAGRARHPCTGTRCRGRAVQPRWQHRLCAQRRGRSGGSVSAAGDVNGDGVDDLLIGAHRADPNGNSGAGASYVVFGASGVGSSGTLELSALYQCQRQHLQP